MHNCFFLSHGVLNQLQYFVCQVMVLGQRDQNGENIVNKIRKGPKRLSNILKHKK
ncbi:hypothetical protein Hanom_Chr15g01345291 [Helianthus anomalus]